MMAVRDCRIPDGNAANSADRRTEHSLQTAPAMRTVLGTAILMVTATLQAHAGVSGQGEASVGASAGAEAIARYWNSSSFVRVTGEVEGRLGTDGAGLTLRQEGHARPYASALLEVLLADRLGFDVAPALADRPDRWRRRYATAGFDVEVIGINAFTRHWGLQFIRVGNGFDWERQHDAASDARRYIQSADWSPVTFVRRADGEEIARLDPIVLEGRAIASDHSGVVLTTFYPRVTGIPLGSARLDVAYGQAETGWSSTSVNGRPPTVITSDQLPNKRVPAARVKLAVPVGDIDVTATGERGMYLGQDATLVVEERATLSLATHVRTLPVRASGFAAHSVIWTSKTDSTEHVTGGISLALDVPLRDHWNLTNTAELARTFYATLDGDRAPRDELGFRVDVGLRKQIPNWVPR
jgi:hypothetical protein